LGQIGILVKMAAWTKFKSGARSGAVPDDQALSGVAEWTEVRQAEGVRLGQASHVAPPPYR
jgi:hypothetical protein